MKKEDAAPGEFDRDCSDKFKIVGYCSIGQYRYPIVEVKNSLGTLASPQKNLVEPESSNFLSLSRSTH